MEFNPKQLKYGEDGVPILQAARIEEIATMMLQEHCPDVLEEPRQTPVLDIIERLRERTKLNWILADLGYRGSAKILGKVDFATRTLALDAVLVTGEREVQFRFTAAHEIGHWVLHRWNWEAWRFKTGTGQEHELQDDEASLCRLSDRTPQEWLEWQANVFAAQVVLPRSTFRGALIRTQVELGIHRNFGEVYLSDADYSLRDFQALAATLGKLYGVSKTSVRVRLATLGFLHDLRTGEARAMRDLPPADGAL